MPDLKRLQEAERRLLTGREYVGVQKIDGPLLFVENTHPIGYRELVECIDPQGQPRLGMVLDTSEKTVVIHLLP